MFKKLIDTNDDKVATLLRWTLGLVILPHGLQKAFGWFGGYGWEGTMGYLTGTIGLPVAIAALVILIEILAPLGLFTGFLSRIAALGIGAVMVGAIFTTHLENGFFMNWGGGQDGEGFEYHLLALGLVIAILIKGSGAFSVDRAVGKQFA